MSISLARTAAPFVLGLALALPTPSSAAPSDLPSYGAFKSGNSACDDRFPDVAVRSGGSFLVVWERACGTSSLSVQLFDVLGRPLGGARDLGPGRRPQVVALSDGGFALTFVRDGATPEQSASVLLARLDHTGKPLGGLTSIRDPRPDTKVWTVPARIAATQDGRLVVAWQEVQNAPAPTVPSQTLGFVRFVGANGVLGDRPYLVGILSAEPEIDVAFETSGRALVVLSVKAMIGYLFGADGRPEGTAIPLRIRQHPAFTAHPTLAARAGGGWWVAWEEVDDPGSPARQDVLLAEVGSDGRLSERSIQSTGLASSTVAAMRPTLGRDPDGNLLVAGLDGSGGFSGRLFDPSGRPISSLFQIVSRNRVFVGNLALAPTGEGGYVGTWERSLAPDTEPEPRGTDLRGGLYRRSCPGSSSVCLGVNSGQALEVSWTQDGKSGTGKGVRIGRDAAVFALANSATFDLAVRVDAAGGLLWAAPTGAAIKFRRIDRATGRVTTVTKPAGQFASGRIAPPRSRIVAAENDAPDDLALEFDVAEGWDEEPASDETAGDAAAVCEPSETTLCLFGGRFAARMTWTDGGTERSADAVQLADRQGFFTTPDGAATLLNMIDGRATNGRYWVYLGGLASVGSRLTVTEVPTGRSRTYVNPAGRLTSSGDRTAF